MSSPILDADYAPLPDARTLTPSRRTTLSELPDLHHRPRFRLPSMITAGMAFVAASGTFYAAQTLIPPGHRPSDYIGGYDREIAKARAEGEASAKFAYEKKMKVFETAAGEWQEQCRAQLQNVNNYTQAVWNRAGIGYQLAADIQRQRVGSRLAVVQGSVGGELEAANMGTLFGYVAGAFDPETGQRAMDFAEAARQQALKKIDEAAQTGVTISPQGWDTGLAAPSTFAASLKCEMPTALLPSSAATER